MLFFYQDFLAKFDVAVLGFITTGVSDLVVFLSPIVTSLLIIYLALWGIAHLMGKIQEPLKDGISRILRIVIVLSLALNVGLYSSLIVNFFYNAPDQLAGVVIGAPPGIGMLDSLLSKGVAEGYTAWTAAGIWDGNFGMYFLALIVWGIVAALTAYAAFLLLISKAALTVLLVLGPLFIIMILFTATQKFFEAWCAQVGNFAIMLVLAVVLIKIMLSLFEQSLSIAVADPDINIVGTFYILLSGIVSVLVLRQVPQLAAALGGGFALSTQGFVGAAMRKSGLGEGARSSFQQSARGAGFVGGKVGGAASRGAANLRRRFGGNSISG